MAPKQSFVDLAAIAQALWTDTNLTENSKLFAKKSERADLLIGNLEHANYNFSPQEAETFLAIFQSLVKGDFGQVREIVAAPRPPKVDRLISQDGNAAGAVGVISSLSAAISDLEMAAAAGRSDQVNEIFHRLAQTNTYLPNHAVVRAMRIAKDHLHDHTSLLLGCYRNVPAGRLTALERAAQYSYWDLVLGFSHTVPIQSLTKVYNLAKASDHQGAAEVVRVLTTAGFVPINPVPEAKLAKNAARAARRMTKREKFRMVNLRDTVQDSVLDTVLDSSAINSPAQQLAYVN